MIVISIIRRPIGKKREREEKKYKIKSSEKAEEKLGPLSLSATIEKYSYYHLPMILRYIPPSSTSFFETTARSFFFFQQLYTLILEKKLPEFHQHQ